MNRIQISGATGTVLVGTFAIHGADGGAANADSTPTVEILDSGGADVATDIGAAIVSYGSGVYYLTIDIANLITHGFIVDVYAPVVTAVVGGTTIKIPLQLFEIVPRRSSCVVVADGSNTATTFKITPLGNIWGDDNAPADALLMAVSGGNIGQIKKITAYVYSTSFITVDGAFVYAPAAGDLYMVVNF